MPILTYFKDKILHPILWTAFFQVTLAPEFEERKIKVSIAAI
jgi:hypothetical protein